MQFWQNTLSFLVAGILNDANERMDVDVEYPLLLKVFEESHSWHLDENIQRYCLDPAMCSHLKHDFAFMNSNLMRSINGYMYGHLPGLKVSVWRHLRYKVHKSKRPASIKPLERST